MPDAQRDFVIDGEREMRTNGAQVVAEDRRIPKPLQDWNVNLRVLMKISVAGKIERQ